MAIGRRFVSGVSKTLYANTRTYAITAGTALQIAYPDSEVIQSDAAQMLMIAGSTADRPVPGDALWLGAAAHGFYDTTLGAPIWVTSDSAVPVVWCKIDGTTA